MIKVVSDSSTLYSINEAKQNHLEVRPLSITINNKSYKELEEITTEQLIQLIEYNVDESDTTLIILPLHI